MKVHADRAWTIRACRVDGRLAVTRVQISFEWFRSFLIMKRCFFYCSAIAILLVSICFISCGSDDSNDNNVPSLDKTNVSLYVGEKTIITYNGGNCAWSSDNELIASVKNGEITAEHVGQTIIHANNTSCTVTVKPKYNSFVEPYCVWGASESTVKSYMSSYSLLSEKQQSSTKKIIIYVGKGNAKAYGYSFENNLLINSALYVDLYKSSQFTDFLLERYWVVTVEQENDGSYYYYLGSVDMKMLIVCNLSTSGTIAMYTEMPSTTKGANLFIDSKDALLKIKTLLSE